MSDLGTRYITAKKIADTLGKTSRHVQKLAQSGKLPFASQPGGPGTAIYFDEQGFHEWFRAGQMGKQKWQVSTGGTASRGGGRRSKAWNTANPLEHDLRERLKRISKNG
jgi:hypothetical protein